MRFLCLFVALFVSPLAHSEEVKYLARPDQALASFHAAMKNARSSIDIATFIFEPCDSSMRYFMDLLAEKADAGVKVRILLDDIAQSSARKKAFVTFGEQHGIEFRFYNTIEKNLRTHIKLMVVDGERYIAGGRNLSDKYFALSAEKNYVDRDLYVVGESAIQASLAFEELWTSRNTSRLRSGDPSFSGWEDFCEFDDSARVQSIRDFLSKEGDSILAAIPQHSCSKVSFVADHADFADGKYSSDEEDSRDSYMNPMRLARKQATKKMLEFLENAQASLSMENWVYMPIYYLADSLKVARDRKVQIRAITNADTEDGPDFFKEAMDYAVQVYSEKHSIGTQKVRRISSKGGLQDRFVLTPKAAPFFLHGKIYVRDKKDVVVSSFNLDSRSYNTNLESLVMVKDCPTLAVDVENPYKQLVETFEEDEATGRVPKKKEPSLAAKIFAKTFLIFL